MSTSKPLTFAQVRRQISADGCIPNKQRATAHQINHIARLVIETGCRWDGTRKRGYRVWEASNLIKTLEEYRDAGGYAAWQKARDELARLEFLEDEGRFCWIKGGHPHHPEYGGPDSYREFCS